MKVGEFAEAVVDVCLKFGGSEISGVRTSLRNHQVGGKENSRHLAGLARDVIFDSPVGDSALAYARRQHGLHGYVKRGNRSVHFQDRAGPPPS